MKIVIVNLSDHLGGAAVVSYRLMNALRDLGADASMLVADKATDSPDVHVAASHLRIRTAFLAEHLRIFLDNGFNRSDLFKVSVAADGLPLSRHPLIREADAVILAWVNQGLLSLKEIRRIADMGKKILWVMHDMWNLTGICHHAGTCDNYSLAGGCQDCPFLHSRRGADDLSRRTWLRKKELYNHVLIEFVAVSSWLAEKCRESSLMRDCDVEVIPNAFPVDSFYITPKYPRSDFGLPENKKIILIGAARLDDPIKGLPYAIEALNKVTVPDAVAVFFGALRDPDALAQLKFPHIWLGPISDPAKVSELYAHADAVLSSSLYETLPGTLIEGQAAGCFPVSFGRGGQVDIIDSPELGYISRYLDTDDLAAGITTALSEHHDPECLRQSVLRKFSATSVATRILAKVRSEGCEV